MSSVLLSMLVATAPSPLVAQMVPFPPIDRVAQLLEWTADPDPELRKRAFRGLPYARDETGRSVNVLRNRREVDSRIFEPLLDALNDPDDGVRAAAADALVEIGGVDATAGFDWVAERCRGPRLDEVSAELRRGLSQPETAWPGDPAALRAAGLAANRSVAIDERRGALLAVIALSSELEPVRSRLEACAKDQDLTMAWLATVALRLQGVEPPRPAAAEVLDRFRRAAAEFDEVIRPIETSLRAGASPEGEAWDRLWKRYEAIRECFVELEELGTEAAPALVPALPWLDLDEVRYASLIRDVVDLIERLGPKAVVAAPVLLRKLESLDDPYGGPWLQALEALGPRAEPEVIAALDRAVADGGTREPSFKWQLLPLVPRAPTTLELLRKWLDGEVDPRLVCPPPDWHRFSSAGDLLLPIVLPRLEHTEAGVRWRAVLASEALIDRPTAIVPRLVPLVADEDVAVRAVEILARIGPSAAAAMAPIEEHFGRWESYRQRDVLQAVGRFGPEAATFLRLCLARSTDPDWQSDCIRSLGDIVAGGGSETAIQALLSVVEQGSPDLRHAAALALSRDPVAAHRALDRLMKPLRDEDIGAALACANVAGDQTAVAILVDWQRSHHDESVASVLRHRFNREAPLGCLLPLAVQVVEDSRISSDARITLMADLVESGEPAGLAALVRVASDASEPPKVRTAALHGIARGAPHFIESVPMLVAATRSTDPSIRRAAWEAVRAVHRVRN